MIKENKGIYEKKVNEVINSDAFRDINFIDHTIYSRLPRQKLLDAVIDNMRTRLMDDDDHLLATKSTKNYTNKLFEVISVLEHDSWNIDEIVVSWIAAEEKLVGLTEFF